MVERFLLLPFEFRYWRTHYDRLTATLPSGHRTSLAALHLDPQQLGHLTDQLRNCREVVIGEVDQDGFLLSHIGPIPGVALVSPENFIPRTRSRVQMVATGRDLGIKKHSLNRWRFLNELKVLRVLQAAGCHVPSLLNVDFNKLSITISYIAGPVLREELAKRSAIVRDRDVVSHTPFQVLDPHELWHARIREGRRVLYSVITRDFAERVFDELRRIHAARAEWGDIKYGNIIIEKRTGQPYFVDFETAGYFPRMPAGLFRVLRDREIEFFNLHFGAEKLTYRRVRAVVRSTRGQQGYGLGYIGAGLRAGKIVKLNRGRSLWHYILKRELAALAGARILELGANNSVMALEMLRQGAREVVRIEQSEEAIARAKFMKEAFEWADNAAYDLRYVQAKLAELSELELGEFDMVVAPGSLYQLEEAGIERLMSHIATITKVFIVECEAASDFGQDDKQTYRRGSVFNVQKLLRGSGFGDIRVVEAYNEARPLLVARSSNWAAC